MLQNYNISTSKSSLSWVHIWVVARQTNLFYLRNQLVLLRKFTYFPQQNNSYSPENQLIFRPFSFAE